MSSSLNNIGLCNHYQIHESVITLDKPTTYLPSYNVQNILELTDCDSYKTDVEAHLKIIEIKKDRLRALTYLAKLQSLVAEIDIAIAEYELKIQSKKLREPQNRGSQRSKNKHSAHRSSKTTHTSESNTPEHELRKSPKNKVYHQNAKLPINLKPQNKVLVLEDELTESKSRKHPSDKKNYVNNLKNATSQTKSGKHPSDKKSDLNKLKNGKSQKKSGKHPADKKNDVSKLQKERIMCSIPFDKIINLQNVSSIGKHIISTHLLQKEQKTEELNTKSNTTDNASNTSPTPCDQSITDQNANTCNKNVPVCVPIQQDKHDVETNSSVNVSDAVDLLPSRKHKRVNTLKVTHCYNYSVIPGFVQNQSGFSYAECDEVSKEKEKTGENQVVS